MRGVLVLLECVVTPAQCLCLCQQPSMAMAPTLCASCGMWDSCLHTSNNLALTTVP